MKIEMTAKCTPKLVVIYLNGEEMLRIGETKEKAINVEVFKRLADLLYDNYEEVTK